MHEPVTSDGGRGGSERDAATGHGESRTDSDTTATRPDGGTTTGALAVDGPLPESPSVAVYVRGAPGCREHERAVIETLESLTESGVLDELTVRAWPEKVSLTGAGASHTDLVEDYQTFAAWADANDASIRPPFVVRDVDSSITDEHDEVLVTPSLLVAVWADGDLVSVYPHCHEDGVASVEDGLAPFLDAAADVDAQQLVAGRAAPTDGGEHAEVNTDEN